MRTQTVPSREELGGLCFFRDSTNFEGASVIRKAWEKLVYMGDGELGKPRMATSRDYEEWRSNRGVPQPSAPLTSSSANLELQEQVAALTKRVEIMGAQLRALEEKKQESALTIDGLRRQCKKKDHEIERLKNECANVKEETSQA